MMRNQKKAKERALFRYFHLLMSRKERSRARFPMKFG